jgi:hypothetical protein
MDEVYAATAATLAFLRDAVDHHSHAGEQIHLVAPCPSAFAGQWLEMEASGLDSGSRHNYSL